MKILYYLDGLNRGGVEMIVTKLANFFFLNGNEIHIIYLYKDRDDLKEDLNPNIILHPLPFDHKKKPYFQYCKYCKQLIKLLKQIQPDIIHAHNSSFSYFFLASAIRLTGLKTINIRTLHFMGFFLERKTLMDRIRFYFDKKASEFLQSIIVPVSPIIKNIVEKQYSWNQVFLITNGIDFNKILNAKVTKSELGIDDNYIVGIYISRICEGKNHIVLLQSWLKVTEAFPNALLILIGDGPLKQEYEDFCNQNELRNNVFFTGSISNVSNYLSISDIGVFPSESEGLSLGLCEMMVAKLPVIVSDIPAFKSIIKDEENGIFFDTYNPEDLANKIIRVLSDNEMSKKLGNNACECVKKNYSIDLMLNKYQNLYRREFINNKKNDDQNSK